MSQLLTQADFTALSGVPLSDAQAARYDRVLSMAVGELERLLGWPLAASDWDNLYLETGKTRDECACPDDAGTLLAADDATNAKYRLYPWNRQGAYAVIDPATAIHAVKLVKDGVTYKTFAPSEYMVEWRNAATPWTKYLRLTKGCYFQTMRFLFDCFYNNSRAVQLAVDAKWAFVDKNDPTKPAVPDDLLHVLADLMAWQFDTKRYIESESAEGHTYGKVSPKRPAASAGTEPGNLSLQPYHPLVVHKATIDYYAGPNGQAKRKRIGELK